MSCTNELKPVRVLSYRSKGRSMIGRVMKGAKNDNRESSTSFFLQVNNILFFKVTMSYFDVNYSFPSKVKL